MYINMVLLSTVAFVAIEQCNSGLRIDEEMIQNDYSKSADQSESSGKSVIIAAVLAWNPGQALSWNPRHA